MLKKILYALVMLAFWIEGANARVAMFPSAANHADPAACGANCYHDLSDFPYWGNMMTAHGDSAGAVSDGSYVFLGKFGKYAYIGTSGHSGGQSTDNTVEFSNGTYAGQIMRATGRVLSANSILEVQRHTQYELNPTPGYAVVGDIPMYDLVLDTDGGGFNIIEHTDAQWAPGCTSVNTATSGAEPCCDGYDLGDGTCSAAGVGDACDAAQGGCRNDTVPTDLPQVVPLYTSQIDPDLDNGAYVISAGIGTSGADVQTSEWWLECATETKRGDNGTQDACCTGTFGTNSGVGLGHTLMARKYTGANEYGGGSGNDCDTAAGYKYMGPNTTANGYAWVFGTLFADAYRPGMVEMEVSGSIIRNLSPPGTNSTTTYTSIPASMKDNRLFKPERVYFAGQPNDLIASNLGLEKRFVFTFDPLAHEQQIAGVDPELALTCLGNPVRIMRSNGGQFAQRVLPSGAGDPNWVGVSQWGSYYKPGVPRSSSYAKSDCGFDWTGYSGDSGSSTWIKHRGQWKLAGMNESSMSVGLGEMWFWAMQEFAAGAPSGTDQIPTTSSGGF